MSAARRCKQLHDDYAEHTHLSKATLHIDLETSNVFAADELVLQPIFPTFKLRHIERCCIKLSWLQLANTGMKSFAEKAAFATPQELAQLQASPSTPTEELCRGLRRLLAILDRIVNPTAHFEITFTLAELPESSPGAPGQFSPLKLWTDNLYVAKSFHATTLLSIAGPGQGMWPPLGRAKIRLLCETPLYCTRVLGSDDMEVPFRASNETVVWQLTPSSKTESWRGLWP